MDDTSDKKNKDLKALATKKPKRLSLKRREVESRQDQLVHLLCTTDLAVNEAAHAVGYGTKYAETGIYKMVKSPRFQEKLKRYVLSTYRTTCIPKILGVDNKVLNHLQKNPLDSNKYTATIKRIQRLTGYLEDPGPPQVQINLGVVRSGLRRFIEDDAPDAEIVEPEALPAPQEDADG